MALSSRSQATQWERGLTMDSPLGSRSATRLMKLPSTSPTKVRYAVRNGATMAIGIMVLSQSEGRRSRAAPLSSPSFGDYSVWQPALGSVALAPGARALDLSL